jgi:hypothetical protein
MPIPQVSDAESHLCFNIIPFAHRLLGFAVNGTGIPDVDFDVGESYAGNLPITSDPNDPNQLYFWFFPSEDPSADKEILIWLNGGVSDRCSPYWLTQD